MIEYSEMLAQQQKGLQEVDSLEGDEKSILQHYSSLLARSVMQQGIRQKAPVDELIINGIKAGIALGLQLKIMENGVYKRS